jgi:sterol desaturase/sphingolipid hydroxylase (fatty acid hydroxylase superfamily)
MILDRIIPDQKLPRVKGWWTTCIVINLFQLLAVLIATFTWEQWLQNTSYFTNVTSFHLRDHVNPFIGGVIAYVLSTWLFYHWHRARHSVYILWIVFHQFHHSPKRIETITSFYKHPFEIVVDSQILAILVYAVLGLTPASSVWLSVFAAIAEAFYHMNIKTPQFIGYFLQRPEAHRCHHRMNKREHNVTNYSDIALWDMLGGTWENPAVMDEPTGFSGNREEKRMDMLRFRDVLGFENFAIKMSPVKLLTYILVIWGSLSSSMYLTNTDQNIQKFTMPFVSSPLPIVFSHYKGVETFATRFHLYIELDTEIPFNFTTTLDATKYELIKGPYNRRNVYGAMFSFGPFFEDDALIKLRDQILKYAVCEPGMMKRELYLTNALIKKIDITTTVDTQNDNRTWITHIVC